MADQANKLRDIIKARKMEIEPQPKLNNIHSSRVITITSGKGGVGKTNFSVNLALCLKKQNKRVLIIDADFGLANIEVLFGVVPRYSLADVILNNKSINEVLTESLSGIRFISGGSGLSELANLSEDQLQKLINAFSSLDDITDFILIDTGAGISKSVVNFIEASGETILITTPEPTSITDAYALIKTVKELKTAPEFKVVVNRIDFPSEGKEVFEKLNKVSERFLETSLKYLGSIPYDHNLIKSVKKQEPVSIRFPNSDASKAIEEISRSILNM